MRSTLPAIAAIALAAAIAAAQPTATITITVNDQSAVAVEPGEIVRLAVTLSHTHALSFGSLIGGVRVQSDAGTGSNLLSTLGSGPLVNTGSFVGGSRTGINISAPPPYVFWSNPLWFANPLPLLYYDIVFAPTEAGLHHIAWEPSPTQPELWLYPSLLGTMTPAQTSYVGATITVTPTPPSLVLLASAALFPLATRRRR